MCICRSKSKVKTKVGPLALTVRDSPLQAINSQMAEEFNKCFASTFTEDQDVNCVPDAGEVFRGTLA